MKERSGHLGEFVMTVILLGSGLGLIYGSAIKPEIGQTIGDALKIPFVGSVVGLTLVLSVLLRWVGKTKKKGSDFINFDSDTGSVGISTQAICDFIEQIGKEFKAVKSIDAKLIEKNKAVDIVLSVKVMAGNKIPELSECLKDRVRESVRDSLGLDDINQITIKIHEIVGKPPAADPIKPAEFISDSEQL